PYFPLLPLITMKKPAAFLITILALAGAFWFGLRQQPSQPTQPTQLTQPTEPTSAESSPPQPPQPSDPTPRPQEQILWTMVDAARVGDVQAYLDCFTGDLRARLQKTVEEVGEAKFADYLKRTSHEPKGLVVRVSEIETVSASEMKVPLEYVYADRNEVQVHRVIQVGNEWKISGVEQTQRIKTLIPYGTEVFPLNRP
ncbi:MAG: hypothetical protein RMK49_17305, partial [Abditibacteriales bacterium]|nr:hypothetical protein [Abditibacteriales bacterium]